MWSEQIQEEVRNMYLSNLGGSVICKRNKNDISLEKPYFSCWSVTDVSSFYSFHSISHSYFKQSPSKGWISKNKTRDWLGKNVLSHFKAEEKITAVCESNIKTVYC